MHYWHHPCGVAVETPPIRIAGGTMSVWPETELEHHALNVVVPNRRPVELLILVSSMDSLRPGVPFRWMNEADRTLSEIYVVPADVGGLACSS